MSASKSAPEASTSTSEASKSKPVEVWTLRFDTWKDDHGEVQVAKYLNNAQDLREEIRKWLELQANTAPYELRDEMKSLLKGQWPGTEIYRCIDGTNLGVCELYSKGLVDQVSHHFKFQTDVAYHVFEGRRPNLNLVHCSCNCIFPEHLNHRGFHSLDRSRLTEKGFPVGGKLDLDRKWMPCHCIRVEGFDCKKDTKIWFQNLFAEIGIPTDFEIEPHLEYGMTKIYFKEAHVCAEAIRKLEDYHWGRSGKALSVYPIYRVPFVKDPLQFTGRSQVAPELRLHFTELDENTTADELRAHIREHSGNESQQIQILICTGQRSQGDAKANFQTEAEAKEALKLDGTDMGGRKIGVSYERTKDGRGE